MLYKHVEYFLVAWYEAIHFDVAVFYETEAIYIRVIVILYLGLSTNVTCLCKICMPLCICVMSNIGG